MHFLCIHTRAVYNTPEEQLSAASLACSHRPRWPARVGLAGLLASASLAYPRRPRTGHAINASPLLALIITRSSQLCVAVLYFLFPTVPLGTLPPLSLIASVATDPPLTISMASTSAMIPPSSLSIPLLATHVPSMTTPPPASHAPAMLLSPALPPVPGKLVTKIQAGNFVHLKELLGDNIVLRQRIEESQLTPIAPWLATNQPLPHMRNITTPLQWIYCMLTYVAVRCPDEATRDRLAYARLVLHLAQKHGGQGWLDYDSTFRAQAASDPTLKWNAINPSLMASAVLSNASSGTYCHHCREVDHSITRVCPTGSRSNPGSHYPGPRPPNIHACRSHTPEAAVLPKPL